MSTEPRPNSPRPSEAIASALRVFGLLAVFFGVIGFMYLSEPLTFVALIAGAFYCVALLGCARVVDLLAQIAANTQPAAPAVQPPAASPVSTDAAIAGMKEALKA